jgi:hypothetical protein
MLICDGCGRQAKTQHFQVQSNTQSFCDLDLCAKCEGDLNDTVQAAISGWSQPRALKPLVAEEVPHKPTMHTEAEAHRHAAARK